MPCDSITLNNVDLGKADREVLKTAIRKMTGNEAYESNGVLAFAHEGRMYRIGADGQLVGDAAKVGQVADELKRGVAREAIHRAAKRFGWSNQVNLKNKKKGLLTRRF